MSKQAEPLIEWSLTKAAREFGLSVPTMKSRLDAAGFQPNAGGKYLTKQIVAAIFTAEQQAKARLAEEQADKVALENRRSRGELIEVSEAADIAARIAASVKAKIMALPLPRDTLKGLLAEIQAMGAIDFEKEAKESESQGT